MADETPAEIKVKLDQPATDPQTPSSLKNARESLGTHIRHELLRESLHTLTGDDKLSNLFAPNQDSSTNSQGNVLRADAQAAFGGSPSASTLRPQQIREVNPEKISGQDIVAAISKMNISLTSGLNNVSQGINNLTVTTSLVNQNINKVSSLLGSVNTSLDRQKSVLDDISDALGRSRYEQPKTNFSGEGSGSNLGRTNIGLENKSPETEKNEHDLIHNVGQVIKEGFEYVIKGAGLGGGAWGFNKLFGGAKAASVAGAGLGMSQMLFGTSALSLAGSASIAAAPFLAGGYAANKYNEAHADTPPVPFEAIQDQSWGDYFSGRAFRDNKGNAEDTIRRHKHQGRNKLGHRHQRSWFGEMLGVNSAEARESQELIPTQSPAAAANPEVVRTDKPQTTDKPLQVAPDKDVAIDAKDAKNVEIIIGGESFARVLEKAFKGMLLGAGAGTILPGGGTIAGGMVGAGTGITKGILDEFKGKDFEALKEQFKAGKEKAQYDMSPEGIRENRKKFMDRIGQTRRANELNAGSATRPSGRPGAGVGGSSGGGGVSSGGSGLSSASETAFAKDVYNKAIAAGIPETQAQMAAMQATLESQHGTSDLARRGSNNYFGIKGKGDAGTSGAYAAYSSPEAGLKAWWSLVQRKWPGAASAKTVQEGIEAEHHGQRGGYSETPNYGERIAQTERRTKGFNSGEPTGELSQVGQAERPSHIGGMIDVEGQKYHFGSGGGGHESIPYGNYPITPNTIGAWG